MARQRMDPATYTAWHVKGLTRLHNFMYGAVAAVAFWLGMALWLSRSSASVWGLVVAAVCVAWGWGVAPRRVVGREQRRVAASSSGQPERPSAWPRVATGRMTPSTGAEAARDQAGSNQAVRLSGRVNRTG
jgi:hypothetical protein